jgi:hypothetical protein
VGGGRRGVLRKSRWETMGRSRWKKKKGRSKVRTVFVAMGS